MTPGALRNMAGLGFALVLVALLAVALVNGDEPRTVRAAFTGATNVIEGNDVRVGGRRVGEVSAVRYQDGQAVLELRIDDDDVWPLRRGTTATFRFGTTISVAARYVELRLGPATAPAIPERGILPRTDTVTPVEFDQALDVLDRKSRADLEALLGNGGDSFGGQAAAIQRTLKTAPGGLSGVADLMHGLGADPAELSSLVSAGSRTARALAARDQELGRLLSSAAGTFDALAQEARPMQASLDRLPRTLTAIRTTLGGLDTTRRRLGELTTDLRPGIKELSAATPSLHRALTVLSEVAPLATSTLRKASRTAPDAVAFMQAAEPLVQQARSAMDKAEPQLACIRPYGPEIAAFIASWAGMTKNFDTRDHYFHTLFMQTPFTTATPLKSDDIIGTLPGVTYAFPRAPGLNVGQAWWNPGCGVGSETTDPAKDPESR